MQQAVRSSDVFTPPFRLMPSSDFSSTRGPATVAEVFPFASGRPSQASGRASTLGHQSSHNGRKEPRLAVRVDRLKNRQITSHLAVRRLINDAIEVPAASNVL